MGIHPRRRWLRIAFLCGMLLAVLAGRDSDGPAAAIEQAPSPKAAVEPEVPSTPSGGVVVEIPERLEPRLIELMENDAFAVKSWAPQLPATPQQPASAAKPVATVIAKPVAPALPFRYLGRLEEDGHTLFFLANGEQNYSVKVGEIMNGGYRFEAAAGNILTFKYLPMDTVQTLAID